MKRSSKKKSLVYDASSMLIDTYAGVPVLGGLKLSYQLASHFHEIHQKELKRIPNGFEAEYLQHLYAHLTQGFSKKIQAVYAQEGRNLSLEQIQILGFSDRDIKNRVANVNCILSDLENISFADNNLISELVSTTPDLSGWHVSCPSCFPCIYSTLVGMNRTNRFGSGFKIIPPNIFGNQQIARHLAKPNSLPDLVFTANSPFFMLGPNYNAFNRYKLVTEIIYYSQIMMEKKFFKKIFSGKDTIAFYKNSIAEQYIMSKGVQRAAVPYEDFSAFYKDPASIENNYVVVGNPPNIEMLENKGWSVAPDSIFDTPVSLFVKSSFLKDKEAKSKLSWFLKAFFMEFDFQSKNIELSLQYLLSDHEFIKSYGDLIAAY